jgi:hypothetical protein
MARMLRLDAPDGRFSPDGFSCALHAHVTTNPFHAYARPTVSPDARALSSYDAQIGAAHLPPCGALIYFDAAPPNDHGSISEPWFMTIGKWIGGQGTL